jgi:hypothetical protein
VRSIQRGALLVSLLAPAFLTAGCHTPLRHTAAGTFETTGEPRVVTARPGIAKQILLYLPNRIVDLFDIVKINFLPLGLSVGPDVRITRWGQVALQAGVGLGVQWDGRDHSPGVANASATAALGPFRTGGGAGEAASIGDWEVGVGYFGGKYAVDLSEVADFVLGWFFIDFKQDDYGWE